MLDYTVHIDGSDLIGRTIEAVHLDSRDCLIRFNDNSILCMEAAYCYDDVVLSIGRTPQMEDLHLLGIVTQEEYDTWEAEQNATYEARSREHKLQEYNRLKEELGL